MLSVNHIIDDSNVGGINKALRDQTIAMAETFNIRHTMLNPRRPFLPVIGDDIVVVHFTPSWSKLPFLTLLRAQLGERPLMIVEHTYTRNFEKYCVPNIARFRRMLRLSYRLADKVVAVSSGQADWMRAAELVSGDKLLVIEQSLETCPLLALSPSNRLSGPLRLAAYGRYCRQKGFDVLIEAVRRLPSDRIQLTLGGYGPELAALKSAASGLPNVQIEGAIADLPTFLASKHIVVMPSRWEAFGLVCREAKAAARPVIASDVDGLSRQITAEMGKTIAPDEPQLLADAIMAAFDWDLRTKGQAARASVDPYGRYISDYENLWNDLATRNGRWGTLDPSRTTIAPPTDGRHASDAAV